jgi:formate dehydrogenase subunit gamma
MPSHEAWNEARAAQIIALHKNQPGPALVVLQALQDTFGYVPKDAVPLVAAALNLSRAEIHGIVTFYHDFRDTPPGRRVIRLCAAEACQSTGSDRLAGHAQARLGIALGDTTADGRITLEPVYCLGLCACAPAAMVDGEVFGRLDDARLDALIAEDAQ